jgi:hypothetical protein
MQSTTLHSDTDLTGIASGFAAEFCFQGGDHNWILNCSHKSSTSNLAFFSSLQFAGIAGSVQEQAYRGRVVICAEAENNGAT